MKLGSNKEQGYLIGLYLGDGYLHYSIKDRHYVVEVYLNSVKDEDIKTHTLVLLRKLGYNVFVQKDKRYNCVKVKINSKELMYFIKQKIAELYTKTDFDKDYLLGLLSGFIDAEGYVGNGNIVITQKDKKVLELFEKYCKIFEIRSRLWSCRSYKTEGYIYRLAISTKFKLLPHNSIKVHRHY